MSSIEAGEILRGKYRIERALGAGGMGVVLLATHLRLGQRVAVKILRQKNEKEDTDLAKRFAREARIASRLRGEHAVRILDVDDSEVGEPFLVMEYLEGTDLEKRVAALGADLSIADAVGYVLQACEGMSEAHALGIVHRDLKPANLFVTRRPDGTELVKILDFGISKALGPEAQDFAITRQETAIGSPSYMSPEQLRDAGGVDVRTDVWALGVVLYQLLTRELPFTATTTAALAARIAADPAPSPRAARGDVPEPLSAVVLRCLEKDPAKRYGTVAELARALAPFSPEGDASAGRTARVANATARQEPDAPPAHPSPTRPAAGPATQSLSDVARAIAPLEPIGGETGSPMTSSAAGAPTPRRRASRLALALSLIAALAAIAGALLLVRLGATRTASVPAASLAPTSLPSQAPPPSEASSPSASAAAPPPSPSVRPAPPRRPSERVVAPARSAPGRNPMDLDFR